MARKRSRSRSRSRSRGRRNIAYAVKCGGRVRSRHRKLVSARRARPRGRHCRVVRLRPTTRRRRRRGR